MLNVTCDFCCKEKPLIILEENDLIVCSECYERESDIGEVF
jgi:hypothetical protein